MSKLPRRRGVPIDENRTPTVKHCPVRAKSRPPQKKAVTVKAVVPTNNSKKVSLHDQLEEINHKNSVTLLQVEERIAQLKKTYIELYECKESRDELQLLLADIINQDVSIESSLKLTHEGLLSEIHVLEGKVSEAVTELAAMNRTAVEMTEALLDEEMKLRGVNKLLRSVDEKLPAAQTALENLKGQILKALESSGMDMLQLTEMCNVVATIHAKCALLNKTSITWDCHFLPYRTPPISQVSLRIIPPHDQKDISNLDDQSDIISSSFCERPDEFLTYDVKVARILSQSGAAEAQVEVSATPITGKSSNEPTPLVDCTTKARFSRCLVPPAVDRDPRRLRATKWEKLNGKTAEAPYADYLVVEKDEYLDQPYINLLADQLRTLVTAAVDPCDGTIRKPETLLVTHLDASDTSGVAFWGSKEPRILIKSKQETYIEGVFHHIVRHCFAVAGREPVEAGIIICRPNGLEPLISVEVPIVSSPPLKKNFRKSISFPDLTADLADFQGEGLFSQLGNSQIELSPMDSPPDSPPSSPTVDSPKERHLSTDDNSICTFEMRVWDSANEFIDMVTYTLNQRQEEDLHAAVLLTFGGLSVCIVHVSTINKRDPNVTETFQQLKLVQQTLKRRKQSGKLPTLSPIGRALAWVITKKSISSTGRDGLRTVCIATITYPEAREPTAHLLHEIQNLINI